MISFIYQNVNHQKFYKHSVDEAVGKQALSCTVGGKIKSVHPPWHGCTNLNMYMNANTLIPKSHFWELILEIYFT